MVFKKNIYKMVHRKSTRAATKVKNDSKFYYRSNILHIYSGILDLGLALTPSNDQDSFSLLERSESLKKGIRRSRVPKNEFFILHLDEKNFIQPSIF